MGYLFLFVCIFFRVWNWKNEENRLFCLSELLEPCRYRLNEEKLEWIVYVTDIGQQQHFDMLFKVYLKLWFSWYVMVTASNCVRTLFYLFFPVAICPCTLCIDLSLFFWYLCPKIFFILFLQFLKEKVMDYDILLELLLPIFQWIKMSNFPFSFSGL